MKINILLAISIFITNISQTIAQTYVIYFQESLKTYTSNDQCQNSNVNSKYWMLYNTANSALDSGFSCLYDCNYASMTSLTYGYLNFADNREARLTITTIPTSSHIKIELYLSRSLIPLWTSGTDFLSVYVDGTTLLFTEPFTTIDNFDNCFTSGTNFVEKVIQYHLTTYVFNPSILLTDPNNFILKITPTLATTLVYGVAGIKISYSTCHSSCKFCNGPLNTNCISCASPNYLNNTMCLTACPASYYFTNNVTRACERCVAAYCDVCSPTNTTQCTQCSQGYYNNYLNGLCETSCPIGYYNGTLVCTLCHSSCYECVSPGTSSACFQCIPTNTYLAASPGQCLTCHSRCADCFSSGFSDCLTCSAGNYLYGTTCNPSCPTGYFTSSGDRQCYAQSSTVAYTSYVYQPFRRIVSASQCNNFSVDPNIYWELKNKTNFNRTEFSFNCLYRCYKYAYNVKTYYSYLIFQSSMYTQLNFTNFPNAYSIKIDYYLVKTISPSWTSADSIFIFLDNQTTALNPVESFGSVDGFVNCYSQNTNSYDNIVYHVYKQHIIAGSDLRDPHRFSLTFYPRTMTNYLLYGIGGFSISYLQCHTTCFKCKGPLNTDCTACDFPLYLHIGTCITPCPFTFYNDDSVRRCFPCVAQNCDVCDNVNTTYCINCTLGFYKHQSTYSCVSLCDFGYYNNTVTNNCTLCNAACFQCTHPGTSSSCTSCNPTGQYLVSNPGTCASCNIACYNCSGAATTQCNFCVNGSYLYYPNTCTAVCPNGQWGSNSNNTCLPCHAYCLICQDHTTTKCTSCAAPSFKVSGQTICTAICPDGYYGNSGTATCNACGFSVGTQTCATCTALTTCTGCAINSFLSGSTCNLCNSFCVSCFAAGATSCNVCAAGKFMLGTTCYTTCPLGYWDNTNNFCTPCDGICNGCTGDGITNCLACINNGFYLTGTTCNSCDVKCQACTGPANTQCSVCQTGYFLTGTTCTSTCAAGTYPNSGTKQCSTCSLTCVTCSGASNCLTCLISQYLSSGQCINCDVSCTACYNTAINCTSCSVSYFSYINNLCLLGCPAGYYANVATTTCTKCNIRCQTCNGGLATNCLSCAPPYSLNGVLCLGCIDFKGFYMDPNNYLTCLDICGDGIRVIPTTQCDDGNYINGDGCSSNCTIESNYKCSGGSVTTRDYCTPINVKFFAKISDNNNRFMNLEQNLPIQIIISFEPLPIFPAGKKLQDYIQISIDSLSSSQYTYTLKQSADNPKLYTMTVIVSTSLQNKNININFQNDDNFTTNIVSSSQQKNQQIKIDLYQFYTPAQREQSGTFGTLVKIFFIAYTAIIFFSVLTNNFFLAKFGLQSIQFLFMFKYSGIRFPLAVYQIMEQLQNSFSFFLPNIATKLEYDNQKTYTSNLPQGLDAIYLKNAGQICLILIITTTSYSIIKFLSKEKVWFCLKKENKKIQRFLQGIVVGFLDYTFVINILETTTPIQIFYGLLQLTNPGSSPITYFSTCFMSVVSLGYFTIIYQLIKQIIANKNQIYQEDLNQNYNDRVVDPQFRFRALYTYLNKTQQKAFIYPIFNFARLVLTPVIIVAGTYQHYAQITFQILFSIAALSLNIGLKCITTISKFKVYLILTEVLNIISCIPMYLMINDEVSNENIWLIGQLMFTIMSIIMVVFHTSFFIFYNMKKHFLSQVSPEENIQNKHQISEDKEHIFQVKQSVKSASVLPLMNLKDPLDLKGSSVFEGQDQHFQESQNNIENQNLNKFHLNKKKIMRRSQFQPQENLQKKEESDIKHTIQNNQQDNLINKKQGKFVKNTLEDEHDQLFQ